MKRLACEGSQREGRRGTGGDRRGWGEAGAPSLGEGGRGKGGEEDGKPSGQQTVITKWCSEFASPKAGKAWDT